MNIKTIMTIKKFKKLMSEEKKLLKEKIDNNTASYSLVYNSTERLKKEWKHLKDSKTADILLGKLVQQENKFIEMIENKLKVVGF